MGLGLREAGEVRRIRSGGLGFWTLGFIVFKV